MEEIEYLKKLEFEMQKNNYPNEYIKKCLRYARKLLENEVPVIYNLEHFSLLTGIDEKALVSIIFSNKDYLYKNIKIPKKTRGYRELSVPIAKLKYLQKWILKNILSEIPVSQYVTGFEKRKSIVENAKKHLNKTCVINLDLKDFFPSITESKVYSIFYCLGYSRELSYIFTTLCTYKKGIPQGAPTSPKLSNLCCKYLDKRIGEVCKKYDAVYSRYADDITISGNKYIKSIVEPVRKIIEDEKFKLNDNKTRILLKGQRQEVTGLNLNSGVVTVPKKYKKQLQKEIYYCKKYGVSNHLEHIKCGKAFYKEHLYGKAYFINMVEPKTARKILKQLDEIEWTY